jgi:hypothetical protein
MRIAPNLRDLVGRKSQNLCGFALSETEGEGNLISPS